MIPCIIFYDLGAAILAKSGYKEPPPIRPAHASRWAGVAAPAFRQQSAGYIDSLPEATFMVAEVQDGSTILPAIKINLISEGLLLLFLHFSKKMWNNLHFKDPYMCEI